MTRLVILAAVALALAGCTATSRAWLRQEHYTHTHCSPPDSPLCQPNL